MFRTSNPAFNNPAFADRGAAQSWDDLGMAAEPASPAAARSNAMTVQGTVNKSALLIAICAATAMVGWKSVETNPGLMHPIWLGSMISVLVLVLISSFKPKASVVTAPLVAIAEGFFVGGISYLFANIAANQGGFGGNVNTGLVMNAGLLTFGIFGGLLAAYAFKLIRPNKLFYNIVITGTIGVAIYTMIAIGASLFFDSWSLASVYSPTNGGMVSIGFSLLVVALASANLVLDFDFINNGARNKAPRYMEWFAAQGLLITLVWLYVEVLRLLTKLQSRE